MNDSRNLSMSTPAASVTTDASPRPGTSPRIEAQPSSTPSGGRWWFAFDRWLGAPAATTSDDDFVLA